MWLLLLACTPPADSGAEPADSGEPESTPPQWDAPADPLDCNEGDDAPLYDAALADAEIDRADVGFTERTWDKWEPYVGGAFQMPFFEAVHHAPEFAACYSRQVAADLDHAGKSAHPVASALAAMMAQAGVASEADPIDPGDTTLAEALEALVDAAGGGDDPSAGDNLPSDLAEALVPVVLALGEALDARALMVAEAEALGAGKARVLYAGGPGLVLSGSTYVPSIADAEEVTAFETWFTTTGPRTLLDPSRRLAFAIENADLSRFAGSDTSWSFATAAGTILVSPSTSDTHELSETALLFHLELGGDDTYVDGAGANMNDDHPVAVTVDLGGNDSYGYAEVADSHDVDGVLPSDEDGRQNSGGYYISASSTARQGAGRLGVGQLYDWGAGADSYRTLRGGQGFGSLGVGVLHDDGGDDGYLGEAGVQGAAVFGYGLFLDGGGNDQHTAWAFSQGFGYAGSVGVAVDSEGDDVYWSDPGNSFGGVTLYASPQLPGGEGNSSFSQGAGFGLRGDAYSQWFAGGLGVLRDSAGNDQYSVGVFGQGTGYWEGTGLLADGAGDDSYDALYYVQGGAAHFATGLFLEQGGNDQYNQGYDSYYMQTGAGHDYSLGLLVDEGGDDVYGYGGLAAGASNCQGVGILVDKDGRDTYDARSTYSTGLGNHSGECESRTADDSIGIFIDGGGDADTYLWTEGDTRTPADDSSFGIEWNGTSDEHGGAVDGDGATGF
ncbi:MAG: hypothetical protein FJ102_01800 [Deltaproteobacteria bacterium]|nr:hypothetical protein [Deltaproteobacteria bacterium]